MIIITFLGVVLFMFCMLFSAVGAIPNLINELLYEYFIIIPLVIVVVIDYVKYNDSTVRQSGAVLLILSLLSYKVKPDKEYLKDIKKLPQQLKVLLDKTGYYKKLADAIYKHEDVFFIGRKVDYAISMEGSLKLKEVSYIHSDSYQAGELKHGTISLINKGTVVVAVITDDDIRDKTISNLEEVISRGAKPIYIGNERVKYKNKIIIPKIHKKLQPLLVVPSLQLISYFVAFKKGCNIDKPKNLAKSVTVE